MLFGIISFNNTHLLRLFSKFPKHLKIWGSYQATPSGAQGLLPLMQSPQCTGNRRVGSHVQSMCSSSLCPLPDSQQTIKTIIISTFILGSVTVHKSIPLLNRTEDRLSSIFPKGRRNQPKDTNKTKQKQCVSCK